MSAPWPVEPGHTPRPAAGACAVGIMAKVPRSGRVKTRLVPPLTHDQASALSECFLRDVAASITAAAGADHVRIQGLAVYLAEGEERDHPRGLPRDFLLLAQRGAHLGERLFHAVEDLLAAGFESVCLVNGDSPTLPSSLLLDAVRALRAPGDRVVLGPASDGGYYLVGLKRAHRRLFEDITWSAPSVFAETVERAREISLEVHRLAEWYDVDDRRSLRLLCQELFGREAADAPPGRGASTRALLGEILPQLGPLALE